MKILFASQNVNKVAEIKKKLPPHIIIQGLTDIGFSEDIPETSDTIAGNASQKSNYLYNKFGLDCFSDDTGLEVNALGGAPGVYSARYAGAQKNAEDNMSLLLEKMKNVEDRSARFITCISFIARSKEYLFEGIVEGEILRKRQGNGGFGYDPIFRPNGFEKSFGEMTLAEKNMISHRAIAVEKLVSFISQNR